MKLSDEDSLEEGNPKGKNTVARFIAKFIALNEVPAVFHLPGGMIAFLTDAIYNEARTTLVTNRNEQASGFAAEGATRVAGKSAIAMGTSGPGATNLITAIASSYFDSVPTIFITGQVNSEEIRKDPQQRQNGFQELEITKLVEGITKGTYSPKTPSEVCANLIDAWTLANTDRKGPVLIDIPIDLQQEEFPLDSAPPVVNFTRSPFEITDQVFLKVNQLINGAERPLILVGGGVRTDDAVIAVKKFIERTGIPAVSSLLGLDSNVFGSPFNLGFIGSYGNSWANQALKSCDVLIVLGSRLDIRQTGASVPEFQSNKRIIRVDIDSLELKGRVRSEIEIQSTISGFIEDLRLDINPRSFSVFTNAILQHKEKFPQNMEQYDELSMNPNEVMEVISRIHSSAWGFIVDVGQHQMWAAQSITLHPGQRFITSGGLGSMGFALPASTGISLIANKRCVVILGDGCAQLSAPELQTIADLNLPLTIYVINNSQHGMVAQFQEEYLEARFIGTRIGYRVPNFVSLATAYGIANCLEVTSIEQFESLEIDDSDIDSGPMFIEVKMSNAAKALPKLSFGR